MRELAGPVLDSDGVALENVRRAITECDHQRFRGLDADAIHVDAVKVVVRILDDAIVLIGELVLLHLAKCLVKESASATGRVNNGIVRGNLERHDTGAKYTQRCQELAFAGLQGARTEDPECFGEHFHVIAKNPEPSELCHDAVESLVSQLIFIAIILVEHAILLLCVIVTEQLPDGLRGLLNAIMFVSLHSKTNLLVSMCG